MLYPNRYNLPPTDSLKPVWWVGSAKADLIAMPAEVVDLFGYALHLAQAGGKHPQAKPLKGFGGARVLEVVDDFRGDTFRAIYTTTIGDAIYVLHCFQKKSTRGIATPRREMEKIHARWWAALRHAEGE